MAREFAEPLIISYNYETFINAAMWTDKAHKLLNKL